MGSFNLAKMTLGSLFKKPATVRYPYEKRDIPKLFPHMRGHVVNDVENCIMCGMCSRVCPADAIAVDRKAGNWTIDPYRCIQCSSCVRECPKQCLSMDVYNTEPTTELHAVTEHRDMPAKPATKVAGAAPGTAKPKRELTAEQQARVDAARKAAAAKKAAAAAAGPAANPGEEKASD